MDEREKPRTEPGSHRPSGLDGPTPEEDRAPDGVTVSYGVYAETLPVSGMTVDQIRHRFGDRFDIAPRSEAILDGRPVGGDTTVRPGQALAFVRRSGEKGSYHVRLAGHEVRVKGPEGQSTAIPIRKLVTLLSPPPHEVTYPDGLRHELRRGPVTIWVHETPPRLHHLQWISDDSPRDHGGGVRYRDVTVALPYVVVFAVFDNDGRLPVLVHYNECFFRTEPLRSTDDLLCYPALLHCLFETGFNRSTEAVGVPSWFTMSRARDPRIATVERWQEASLDRPLFVLDVPWLEVGKSVRQVAERIYETLGARSDVDCEGDLARLVLNRGRETAGSDLEAAVRAPL